MATNIAQNEPDTVEEWARGQIANYTTPPERVIYKQREPETLDEWAADFENDPGPLERWAATLPNSSLTAEKRKELDERAKRLASDPTGAAGTLEHAAAIQTRPWEYGYFEQKYYDELNKSKPASELSTTERVQAAGHRGALGLGKWALDITGTMTQEGQLDDDQELFKQRLDRIRGGVDPLVDPNAPWWKRGMVGAAEQYPTMVTSVATGGLAGAGAKAVGLGSLGIRLASGAGVGAVYYKQMRDETYFDLLRAGVSREIAGPAAAISGILQGAAEGLPIANPFSTSFLNKTIRSVAVNQMKRFGIETAGEEFGQALIDGTVQELTKRSVGLGDKDDELVRAAREVFVDAAKETWEGMPTATFLMGPGMVLSGAAESASVVGRGRRLAALKALRANKDWVTVEEGRAAGLSEEELKNRDTRKAAVDELIRQSEQALEEARQAQAAPVAPPDGSLGPTGPVATQPPPVDSTTGPAPPQQPPPPPQQAPPVESAPQPAAQEPEPTAGPQVGQFAQGKWDKPRKITGVSEDGQFVFVEGSSAGIPAAEITAVDEAEVVLDDLKNAARQEVRDWKRRTKKQGGTLANATLEGLQEEADKARKLLGLKMKDDMSPAAIDKAVRLTSLESHPDLGGSQEQQAAVNAAGELLKRSPGILNLAKHLWEQRQKPSTQSVKPAKRNGRRDQEGAVQTRQEALEAPPAPPKRNGRRDQPKAPAPVAPQPAPTEEDTAKPAPKPKKPAPTAKPTGTPTGTPPAEPEKPKRTPDPGGRSDSQWDEELGAWVSPSGSEVFDFKAKGGPKWRSMTPEENVANQQAVDETAQQESEATGRPVDVAIKGAKSQDIPVSSVQIDPKRFQFKGKVDAKGVQEPLEGDFDPLAAKGIFIWEDKSGKRYVVNGHHRFDLAQRAGVETIEATVLKETDGITAAHAKMLGAELNIKEGQGTIDDYATFFRESGIEEAEAKSRGLLARGKGKSGFLIGKFAANDVYDAFRSGQVTAEVASTIADVGRDNEAIQNLGLARAKSKRNPKGMPAAQLREFLSLALQAPKRKSTGKKPKQGDLFGFDDSAIQEAEEMSKIASRIIGEMRERIRAVQGALRRPEQAKEMGLSGDMEAIQKEVSQLQDELAEWENWTTNPELTAQVRKEAWIETPEAAKPDQSAIPGFEDEAASVEEGEKAKRDKEKRKEDAPPPGKQSDLFSTEGDKDQRNLFPDDGIPEDMVGDGKSKPKGKRPGGSAMASLTEGDSYQPTQPEEPKEPRSPGAKAAAKAKANAEAIIADLVGMASPAHVSDLSREAGHTMREEMARAAQWDEVSREALRKMERTFWMMSPEKSYEFMDRLEAGEKQATPELDEIAEALRTQLDNGRDRLQSLGKLRDFYENYFPHMWKNPTHAQDVIRSISAGKPWRSGGFLKKRTHITHKEGRDAGLKPISDNPIEMALLRLHQINKYVSRTNIMERLKQAGLMKFVPEKLGKSNIPYGYEYYDDPAFRVEVDPSITMEESYDKLLVDQLSAVLNRLGVNHQRVAKMSYGKWGVSQGKGIKTRFAGPVSVLAHELGHQIGETWGLFEYLTKGAPVEGRLHEKGKRAGQEVKSDARRKRAQMQKELRDLADLRVEAQEDDVVEGSRTYRRKKAEKEAVILEAWLAAPEKMAEVAPMVTEAWKEFLAANEPVAPLLNLDRSVVLGTREQVIPQKGTLTLGKWAMPSDVARMVKNMLSPGLRGNPNRMVKGLYNLARIFGNAMNQASLSLSGFHALNVTTDRSASQIGLGMQQASRGKLGRAMGNVVRTPYDMLAGGFQGRQLKAAMRTDLDLLSPEMQAFVEMAIRSGARASMDPLYHNFAIRGVANSIRNLRYGSVLSKADASIRLPIQVILSGLELTAKPTMEWMVPNLKLVVLKKLAEDVYDRANIEGLSEFQINELLSQAQDSVDNRLGQLPYDNLFWNAYAKDVSMLSVRSVGWNLGSFREYGGAVVDIANTRARLRRGDQLLSKKMTYAVGAVVTYATIGAMLMYGFTGEWPEELKDYFFPKTGRTNPDGSPERLSLPTYSKDVIAWTTQPLTVAKHKLHPMWGTMADVLTNEDYYGVKIRQEDDPWYVQLEDTMNHVLEAYVPFSIKNMARFIEAGEDPRVAIPMALSGITSAPAYISRSPAQKLAYAFTIENIPQGSRNSEQAEASEKRKELVKRMRHGGSATDEEMKQYSKLQMKLIEKQAKQTPFQAIMSRLTSDQSMKVWERASEEEKQQVREPILRKVIRQAAKGDESVNEWNDAKKGKVYLKQLGITSHGKAQQILVESYWTVKKGRVGSELNATYLGQAKALDKLYEKPEGTYLKWREKAGLNPGETRNEKRAEWKSHYRPDGTKKGTGFLGTLELPGGGEASEYSIGVGFDGVETLIPSLVPTLTAAERQLMIEEIIPAGKQVPAAIRLKAAAHAKKRMRAGKPVFAN